MRAGHGARGAVRGSASPNGKEQIVMHAAKAAGPLSPRSNGSAAILGPGTDAVTGPVRRGIYLNDIRDLAYEKWESAGRPAGDCTRFWLEAEKALLEGGAH